MSRKKERSYRVRFVEWALYETTEEAHSAKEALAKAYTAFCEAGTDGCKLRDNGTELWSAEAEGDAVEVAHPTELEGVA